VDHVENHLERRRVIPCRCGPGVCNIPFCEEYQFAIVTRQAPHFPIRGPMYHWASTSVRSTVRNLCRVLTTCRAERRAQIPPRPDPDKAVFRSPFVDANTGLNPSQVTCSRHAAPATCAPPIHQTFHTTPTRKIGLFATAFSGPSVPHRHHPHFTLHPTWPGRRAPTHWPYSGQRLKATAAWVRTTTTTAPPADYCRALSYENSVEGMHSRYRPCFAPHATAVIEAARYPHLAARATLASMSTILTDLALCSPEPAAMSLRLGYHSVSPLVLGSWNTAGRTAGLSTASKNATNTRTCSRALWGIRMLIVNLHAEIRRAWGPSLLGILRHRDARQDRASSPKTTQSALLRLRLAPPRDILTSPQAGILSPHSAGPKGRRWPLPRRGRDALRQPALYTFRRAARLRQLRELRRFNRPCLGVPHRAHSPPSVAPSRHRRNIHFVPMCCRSHRHTNRAIGDQH